jgi:hypothetical protein
MGMADPHDLGPQTLTLKLTRDHDPKLTCVLCWREHVDYSFETRVCGRRSWHGIHLECARESGLVEPIR